MRRFWHWLMYSVTGNIAGAVACYPVGLIWWSPLTDLYWTVGCLALNLVLLRVLNKKSAA